jgi:hypothetical protein
VNITYRFFTLTITFHTIHTRGSNRYNNHWIYGQLALYDDTIDGLFTTSLSIVGSYDDLGYTTMYLRFGNIPSQSVFDIRVSGMTEDGLVSVFIPSPYIISSGFTNTNGSGWYIGIYDPQDRNILFSFSSSTWEISEVGQSGGDVNEYGGNDVEYSWTYYVTIIFTIVSFIVVVTFILFLNYLLSRRSSSPPSSNNVTPY